jgi:hypothetical protein
MILERQDDLLSQQKRCLEVDVSSVLREPFSRTNIFERRRKVGCTCRGIILFVGGSSVSYERV